MELTLQLRSQSTAVVLLQTSIILTEIQLKTRELKFSKEQLATGPFPEGFHRREKVQIAPEESTFSLSASSIA